MRTSATCIVNFVKLPKIWEENKDKLPKDLKIDNLMLK